MPPVYRHPIRHSSDWNSPSTRNPSNRSSASSSSSPVASTSRAAAIPGSHKSKRKSIPYKSPTTSQGATAAATKRSSGGAETTVNVNQLLRVLAREHAANQLDSQRYRPTTTRNLNGTQSTSSAHLDVGIGGSSLRTRAGSSQSPEKGKRVYKRDVLIPMDTHYGRGKRSASTGAAMRGRSPTGSASVKVELSTTATAKSRLSSLGPAAPIPSSSASTMLRSRSQEQHHHLSVPSRSPQPLPQVLMNRSTSLGPSASSLPTAPLSSATSPVVTESTLVVMNSPLARSFTSNSKGEIEEKLATPTEGRRSRNPSTSLVSPRTSPRTQAANAASMPAVGIPGLTIYA